MGSERSTSQWREEIPEYLAEVLSTAEIDEHAGQPLGDEKIVDVYLAKILRSAGEVADAQLLHALAVMCRKLSVQRLVRASYDSEWKMAVKKDPLDRKWWPSMLYLLLMVPADDALSEYDRTGVELGRVNAALVGFDVASKLGVDEAAIAKLRQLADRRIDELTVRGESA